MGLCLCLLRVNSLGEKQTCWPSWEPGKPRSRSESPRVPRCACLSVPRWHPQPVLPACLWVLAWELLAGLPGLGHGKKVFTSSRASSETLRCVNASFLLHTSSLPGSAWGFPGLEGKKLKLPLAVGLSHGAGTIESPWRVLVPQAVTVSSSQPAAQSRRAMAPCPSSRAWLG